jgi:hypothetical protein
MSQACGEGSAEIHEGKSRYIFGAVVITHGRRCASSCCLDADHCHHGGMQTVFRQRVAKTACAVLPTPGIVG